MTILTCAYCPALLAPPSDEHVILSALGGRKITNRIACGACNNHLGDKIDKPLAESLHVICNQIGIRPGRGNETVTLRGVEIEKGGKVNIAPGGRPVLPKTTVDFADVGDGKRKVKIRARTMEEAAFKMAQIARGFPGQPTDVKVEAVQKHVGLVELGLTPWEQWNFRSIAKMMFTYLSMVIPSADIRSNSFRVIREFIRHGATLPGEWVGHDYDTVFPDTASAGVFQHHLVVFSEQECRTVVGLLELFGHLKFSAVLSNAWDGERIRMAYILDPVAGRGEEHSVDILPSVTIGQLEAAHKGFMPGCQKTMDSLTRAIVQKQWTERCGEIASDGVADYIEGKGEIVTEEMIQQLAASTAENFTRSLFQIDSSKDMTEEFLEEQFDSKSSGNDNDKE